MKKMHPTSRPAGYKHVRAIGDDVQSLNKIEIPKNKNFQNFQIFTPRGAYWYTGKRKIVAFLLLRKYNKINRKSYVRNRIFSIPRLPMAQKWSFNGRRDLLKMSPKSTRERTADPAPTPKWPKDTPKSRSQHSGRVGRQSYARFKAEIELHNIRTTTEHDSQPPTVHFGFLCPAAATPAPSRPVPHSD